MCPSNIYQTVIQFKNKSGHLIHTLSGIKGLNHLLISVLAVESLRANNSVLWRRSKTGGIIRNTDLLMSFGNSWESSFRRCEVKLIEEFVAFEESIDRGCFSEFSFL
ncbi:hypothetical protein L1887_10037 [Cichorium endivia]|nr:hypothetical protein L1887_10037 [Cichorium endivia]